MVAGDTGQLGRPRIGHWSSYRTRYEANEVRTMLRDGVKGAGGVGYRLHREDERPRYEVKGWRHFINDAVVAFRAGRTTSSTRRRETGHVHIVGNGKMLTLRRVASLRRLAAHSRLLGVTGQPDLRATATVAQSALSPVCATWLISRTYVQRESGLNVLDVHVLLIST